MTGPRLKQRTLHKSCLVKSKRRNINQGGKSAKPIGRKARKKLKSNQWKREERELRERTTERPEHAVAQFEIAPASFTLRPSRSVSSMKQYVTDSTKVGITGTDAKWLFNVDVTRDNQVRPHIRQRQPKLEGTFTMLDVDDSDSLPPQPPKVLNIAPSTILIRPPTFHLPIQASESHIDLGL